MKDTRVCFFWKQRPKSYKSSCAAISRADKKKRNRQNIETQTARCDSDCSNKGMDLMTITAMWWNYCMEERWVSNPDVSGRNESNDDQNKGIRANERISRRGVMDTIVKE